MDSIDTSRRDLIDEFRNNPVGRSSGDLRRLLNALRMHPDVPSYILVCMQPQREWRIAVKPPGRGTSVELVDGPAYDDPLQAEWAIFKLRWQALTGEDLDP